MIPRAADESLSTARSDDAASELRASAAPAAVRLVSRTRDLCERSVPAGRSRRARDGAARRDASDEAGELHASDGAGHRDASDEAGELHASDDAAHRDASDRGADRDASDAAEPRDANDATGHRGDGDGGADEGRARAAPTAPPGSRGVETGVSASAAGDETDEDLAPTLRSGAGTPAVAPQPVPRTLVAGRYRLLREIGRGGMGVVYLAEHVFLKKQLALKLLPEEMAREPEQARSFLREARAASQLVHDHIVQVTDFGDTGDGTLFYTMEHLEGEDLAHRLRRTGRCHPARARRIALDLCGALAHVHAAGYIHRDLKPENVFLVERGDTTDFVKLLDFGIVGKATARPLLDGQGRVLGTPEYISPEQAAGEPIDARADLYALGCILYEMLTGSVPFSARDAVTLLGMHLVERPQPPSDRAPDAGVPAALEDVVMRALAKEPSARYQSADEMARALAQAEDARLRDGAPPAPPPEAVVEEALAALDRGARGDALSTVEALVRGGSGALDRPELAAHRSGLERIYAAVCGRPDEVPSVVAYPTELDSRGAFLLSRIDGQTSIADVVLLSGMPRLETLRQLALFLDAGYVTTRHRALAP